MKSKAASSIKTVVSVKIGLVFTTSCWKVVAAEAVLIPMLMMLFWRKDVVLQMHVMANKSKRQTQILSTSNNLLSKHEINVKSSTE